MEVRKNFVKINEIYLQAAPTPLTFNPDQFFATLEVAGPQLTLNNTGIKGDWVGLYKKFFRSPNFKAWFNMRYMELTLKLQALQLEALSNAVRITIYNISVGEHF